MIVMTGVIKGKQARRRQGLFVMLALVFVLSGCAGKFPQVLDISGDESERVEAAFSAMLEKQQLHECLLDAEVDVTFVAGRLLATRSGRLNGYLQIMPPSHVKFIALNPIGQPLVIMAADGRRFHTVVIPEARDYEGEVASKTFRKYSPPGFDPADVYYWFAGRVAPGPSGIRPLGRDAAGSGYWLSFGYADDENRHYLRLEPDEGLVMRHLVQDSRGRNIFDVSYDAYQVAGGNGACSLPAVITVQSAVQAGKMEITMDSFLADAVLTARDFTVESPAGYERVVVK